MGTKKDYREKYYREKYFKYKQKYLEATLSQGQHGGMLQYGGDGDLSAEDVARRILAQNPSINLEQVQQLKEALDNNYEDHEREMNQ